MDKEFYFARLYPLQDRVLETIGSLDTQFYLTGGTASSRGYLHHRFSDDLDFFVNDDSRFRLWSDRIITALSAGFPTLQVLQNEERFTRLSVQDVDVALKIELVNDVPSHVGSLTRHKILGLLDSPENILANKVSAAIDRKEPKDFADIWGFCCKMGLSLTRAITGAQSKAAGIFPADLARTLCSVTEADWQLIRWIDPPTCNQFLQDLNKLSENLILP